MELGAGKIILIMLVALLVFGAKRIPEIGQGLGKGIREFKKSINELQSGTMEDNVRSPSETARPVEHSAEPQREVKRLM